MHAAEGAVQLAGFGMTWGHPTHLDLKKAKVDRIAVGAAGAHRAALARSWSWWGRLRDRDGHRNVDSDAAGRRRGEERLPDDGQVPLLLAPGAVRNRLV